MLVQFQHGLPFDKVSKLWYTFGMKSTWTYHGVDSTRQMVFIIDNDVGMSVTNDAENVVEVINARYPGYRIIYRDTEFRWDELLHESGVFKGFAPFKRGV